MARFTFQVDRVHKVTAVVDAGTTINPRNAEAQVQGAIVQSLSVAIGEEITLEKGAVSAYLGAVPIFANRELSKAAASILGDEAMHWAVLRNALGDAPVPAAFVS